MSTVLGDRHHFLHVVEAHFRLIDDRRDRIGRHIADHQRRAVGRRLHHFLDRQHAEGAGLVLDIKLLAEAFAELIGEDARDDVGGPARPVRHDDLDRMRRILVRRLSRAPRPRRRSTAQQAETLRTSYFPSLSRRRSCEPLNCCSSILFVFVSPSAHARFDFVAARAINRHAALMPCRLCEASLTVKKTTSASAPALPS